MKATLAPDIEAIAKRHMETLCNVLTHDPETRKEVALSLKAIFEWGKQAGALEQAARTEKTLAETASN